MHCDTFIRKIAGSKDPDKFKKLIRHASKSEMQSLIKCYVKVLRREIPVSARVRKRIIKHRRFLRHLVHPSYSMTSKKKYVLQTGGAGGFKAALSAARIRARATLSAMRPSVRALRGAVRSAPNLVGSRVAGAPLRPPPPSGPGLRAVSPGLRAPPGSVASISRPLSESAIRRLPPLNPSLNVTSSSKGSDITRAVRGSSRGSSVGPPRSGGTYNVPQWVQESQFSGRPPRDIIRPVRYGFSTSSGSNMGAPVSQSSILSAEFPADESLMRRAVASATRRGERVPVNPNVSSSTRPSEGFFKRARGGNKSVSFVEPQATIGEDVAFQGPLPKYQRLTNESTIRSLDMRGVPEELFGSNRLADQSASSMFSRTPKPGPYGPQDMNYQRLGSNRSIHRASTQIQRGNPVRLNFSDTGIAQRQHGTTGIVTYLSSSSSSATDLMQFSRQPLRRDPRALRMGGSSGSSSFDPLHGAQNSLPARTLPPPQYDPTMMLMGTPTRKEIVKPLPNTSNLMNFSQPSGAPTNVPPKQPFNAAQLRKDIVNYKPSAYSNEADLARITARQPGGAYAQNEANLARAIRGFDGTGSRMSSFYAGPTRMQRFGQFVKKHAAGAGVSAGIVGGIIGAAAGIKNYRSLI